MLLKTVPFCSVKVDEELTPAPPPSAAESEEKVEESTVAVAGSLATPLPTKRPPPRDRLDPEAVSFEKVDPVNDPVPPT